MLARLLETAPGLLEDPSGNCKLARPQLDERLVHGEPVQERGAGSTLAEVLPPLREPVARQVEVPTRGVGCRTVVERRGAEPGAEATATCGEALVDEALELSPGRRTPAHGRRNGHGGLILEDGRSCPPGVVQRDHALVDRVACSAQPVQHPGSRHVCS